jgi:hypothetical protein
LNLSFFTQASMPVRLINLLFLDDMEMMRSGMNIDHSRKTL